MSTGPVGCIGRRAGMGAVPCTTYSAVEAEANGVDPLLVVALEAGFGRCRNEEGAAFGTCARPEVWDVWLKGMGDKFCKKLFPRALSLGQGNWWKTPRVKGRGWGRPVGHAPVVEVDALVTQPINALGTVVRDVRGGPTLVVWVSENCCEESGVGARAGSCEAAAAERAWQAEHGLA